MALLNLAHRVAIVTGAGRGLGRSHASLLAARGARVVVNDLRPAGAGAGGGPASEVVAEITAAGGIAVADEHSVVGAADGVIRTALDTFGRLDIIINNAGVLSTAPFAQARAEDWQAVFDVHFRGTVEICRAAWPHLARSGSGRIINTCSSGMLGNAGLTSYGSAKAGIFGLTRSLAIEGESAGILVNSIFPSAWTRITMEINDPGISATLQKYFQPEHVSALVVWLSHQDCRITNQAFQVSGGRAGRLSMAMMPTTRVEHSTPEVWAERQQQLMADGPLTALATTAEMFGNELADADPEVRHAMNQATGGLALKPLTGREVNQT